jgi:hypothetical protein
VRETGEQQFLAREQLPTHTQRDEAAVRFDLPKHGFYNHLPPRVAAPRIGLAQLVALTGMTLLSLYGAISYEPHMLLEGRAVRAYSRSVLSTIAEGPSDLSRDYLAPAGIGLPHA